MCECVCVFVFVCVHDVIVRLVHESMALYACGHNSGTSTKYVLL